MEQKKKTYSTPPLPFRGNKRYFVKEFRKVLQNLTDIEVVVDLFGGSGLLSRAAKDVMPHARVIYNDFDGYSKRLENIERTNEIFDLIRPFIDGVDTLKRVPEGKRNKILDLLPLQEEKGFVDYITISSGLLWPGQFATSLDTLSKHPFYNNARQTPYSAEGYLDGLEITCKDYRELFEEFKDREKVLFLLDPPYLQTDMDSYHNSDFWTLGETLDVVRMMMGSKFIFFTSDKSDIPELLDWLSENTYGFDFVKKAEIHKRTNFPDKIHHYDDFMYVLF